MIVRLHDERRQRDLLVKGPPSFGVWRLIDGMKLLISVGKLNDAAISKFTEQGVDVRTINKRIKPQVDSPKSEDAVAVIPTLADRETVMIPRKWLHRRGNNPERCYLVHRRMLFGWRKVLKNEGGELSCQQKLHRPYRPTYLRLIPKAAALRNSFR